MNDVPEISRFYGIVVRMYSRGERSPPHFHVQCGEYRASFSINDLDVLEGDLPLRARNRIHDWASAHNRSCAIIGDEHKHTSPCCRSILFREREPVMSPILVSVEFLDGHIIRATLDDGTTRDLDFELHLWGPMFAPLKDPAVFRSGRVDQEAQTVVWPNGADIAPEVWARGFPESSARKHAS